MKIRTKISYGILMASLCLAGIPGSVQAQTLGTIDYVTMKGGRMYVVANNESVLLRRAMTLTEDLTVMTNGVIKITSGGEEELTESRRLSLDGFWLSDDGTFLAFKPHYMIKDGALCFVKSGVLTRVDQDVTLGNGTFLRTDATLLTPDERLLRLQDGHMLAVNGETIPPLDHVMMIDGKLVLQKDGSIIPLPVVSTIGMSDGTRVTGNGTITKSTGEQFTLTDGQRLTLDGAVMPRFQ